MESDQPEHVQEGGGEVDPGEGGEAPEEGEDARLQLHPCAGDAQEVSGIKY